MLKFSECEKITKARGKKIIKNNTLLWRVDADTFCVRYHSTEIVTIHRNGRWTVDNGGFKTATTKQRLNQYSPASVFQRAGDWFFWIDGKAIPYQNGAEFSENGRLAE